MSSPAEVAGVRRTWLVRAWIKTVAVIGWLGLLAQQFSTIHFVRMGETDPLQITLGWSTLAVLAIGIALLAFRPYIRVDSKTVVLQGPLRRTAFPRSEVVDVAPTAWGLGFTDRDGTRRTSIVCQDTKAFGEPRWLDVAEAATGVRPPARRN